MSSTVAAIIGMIPEGLYLLVSVALAVSVISLARSKTLVHELSCIENLARVDTLCLDKTGTITEGCMEVLETIPVPGMEGGALGRAAGQLYRRRGRGQRHGAGSAGTLRRFGRRLAAQSRRPLQLRAQVGCSGAERRRRIHPRRTGDRAGRRVCPPSGVR